MEGEYETIRAGVTDLEGAVEELRRGGFAGLNVTMPLKGAAAALADRLTDLAERAASVNTLRARAGKVEAHSTDAVAFQELFTEPDRFAGDAPVLVLGSGGSARAALAALTTLGRDRVYVSARTEAKARRLAEIYGARALAWGSESGGALLVNATPIGMEGEDLPPGVLESAIGLIDLPYASGRTPAFEEAVGAGIPCADGIEFLARQAAASFLWWTGEPVDFDVLVSAARNV